MIHQQFFFFFFQPILLSSLPLCERDLTHSVGLFLSLGPGKLAVNALPVRRSIAKVVWRLSELYVVELGSRLYDVNIHHRTNLIGLHSLSLSENVATAFFVSSNRGWVTRWHFSRIQGRALIFATVWKNPGVWLILQSERSSTELASPNLGHIFYLFKNAIMGKHVPYYH